MDRRSIGKSIPKSIATGTDRRSRHHPPAQSCVSQPVSDPSPPEAPGQDEVAPEVVAGIACVPLLANPATWINRRVETIEMLSHEETRRRVSIDFSLSSEQLAA